MNKSGAKEKLKQWMIKAFQNDPLEFVIQKKCMDKCLDIFLR